MKSWLINPQTGSSPALWGVRLLMLVGYVAVFSVSWGWMLLLSLLCVLIAAETAHMWITLKCTKNPRAAKILAWILDQHAVEVMDCDSQSRLTLVRRTDSGLEGHTHPLYKMGELRMLPNGYVDPTCAASFFYVWRPLDRSLEIELRLSCPTPWPNWDSFAQMSHIDKIVQRRKALADSQQC